MSRHLFLSIPILHRLAACRFALPVILLAWVGACQASDQTLTPLTVETAEGTREFLVELADEPEERQRGLMFRTELATDRGMLFVHSGDAVLHMWMKNTYIPLDMLFIDSDGRIAAIIENAEPRSERILSSGVPVRAVLELAGGVVSRLEIGVGDRVRHMALEGGAP